MINWLKKQRKKIEQRKRNQQQHQQNLELAKQYHVSQNQPIYYVISCNVGRVGLFSYVNLILSKINSAVREGWIPVVDMQSHASTYLEERYIHQKNAWDYYFEQPGRVSLEEALESKNVIKATEEWNEPGPYSGMAFYRDQYGEKTYWRRFAHQYLKIKPSILNKADDWCEKHWNTDDRVLGVLCRGTDYVKRRPEGHPIQPIPQDVVVKSRELMERWQCTRIYLCTEDASILSLFQNAFDQRCCFLGRNYIEDIGDDVVTRVQFDRDDDQRLQGEEYLLQVLILSKCHFLLAGQCGGTLGAELLTKGYEQEYIWDLGRY